MFRNQLLRSSLVRTPIRHYSQTGRIGPPYIITQLKQRAGTFALWGTFMTTVILWPGILYYRQQNYSAKNGIA